MQSHGVLRTHFATGYGHGFKREFGNDGSLAANDVDVPDKVRLQVQRHNFLLCTDSNRNLAILLVDRLESLPVLPKLVFCGGSTHPSATRLHGSANPLCHPERNRQVHRVHREPEGKISGIPHLAKNERDTRISCTGHQATATCAAFIEESRMKSINANELHQKIRGYGAPVSCSREREAGRFLRNFSAGAWAGSPSLGPRWASQTGCSPRCIARRSMRWRQYSEVPGCCPP